MTTEQQRLQDPAWRQWGPYVSDRQWGTVREDYSANGDAWNYTTHDMARSYTYRWGEDGIGGFCDDKQQLCLALALWNGSDPIIKERYFGLTNGEGNHGEDVKELYYYLDNTPSHSYQRMLYKYPQAAYPYTQLIAENRRRTRQDPEFELLDTGLFDEDRYFDVFIEYAKAGPQDILMTITVVNRGPETAQLHVFPTLWFRNTWVWGDDSDGVPSQQPQLSLQSDGTVLAQQVQLGRYVCHAEGQPDWLFCENESNLVRLYNTHNGARYPKDGINDHVVYGADTVNPEKTGTKAAAHYVITVEAGGSTTIRLRLESTGLSDPFADFDAISAQCKAEADAFYASIHPAQATDDEKLVQRQAFAGMLWSKQYYYYDVSRWLSGDPNSPPPPPERAKGRNHTWLQLINAGVISMPDKWEYPWYAAWDWAFHCVTFAVIDPGFAKQQLMLLTNEWFMHPNGQLPAYEWSFSDVNPPVHAWASWRIYRMELERKPPGEEDIRFLRGIFHKLLLNFTWWVNRKDESGNNIFEGGFLGLDNIGVFDRNAILPDGSHLEQADGTSWMAMYALNMMRIALELAQHDPVYDELATKFFDHFLYIAGAMTSIGENSQGLWDEQDGFFYDQLRMSDGNVKRLRVRTMVGLIPMFAVEILSDELLQQRPGFRKRMEWFQSHRPDLYSQVSRYTEAGKEEKRLLSLLRGFRLKSLLSKILDETEFLSPHGVRAVSKVYRDQPYEFTLDDTTFRLAYTPAESDSAMFGGNSNWRGPVWMPLNYLMIESIERFYDYFGDDFTVEYPIGSGKQITLKAVACELTCRLISLFTLNESGQRVTFGQHPKYQDPHFRDYVLFYEYFDGDNGRGVGASHQTGWTGLVAELIDRKYDSLQG
ncbi:MGH1-like glycoside hydrolase domain-containing protein [Spirosoma oryzicola]|uniref:MGH1-like glycoside hydrolase domain-containing protein n=1 Tax=Spirosoma oryzicola TaxID=2898794 RepID=UPI001E3C0147|nr:glucosidase [Spirosoma oryzicola]UHG89661.1 glucosidase [Spirosoma oryzicola]